MPSTDRFKRKNVPNKIIDNRKKWIIANPSLARMKPKELDHYDLEVFGDNSKLVADDLHKALKESGFLAKHPLFRIRVETM